MSNNNPLAHCIYGDNDADSVCEDCLAPLCSGCGFKVTNKQYCNDCYEKKHNELLWKDVDYKIKDNEQYYV